MVFCCVEPGNISLLAHSVQEKDSPTYADPKAGGRVRSGDRMKASFLEEGYASDADVVGKTFGDSLGDGDGVGRGCWIESDGRESLPRDQ